MTAPATPRHDASPATSGSPGRSVEAFVSGLAGDGRAATPGHFTLDPERFRELLRDFQLPDPAAYVLLLVQAAVLRGARSVRVTTARGVLSLAFDGAAFTREELDARYERLLIAPTGDAGASVRRLALGLHGLWAFDPRAEVSLHTGSGHSGLALALGPGHAEARAVDAPAVRGTVIDIRRRAAEPPRDAELVASLCRHAGIDITLDGRRVTDPEWEPDAFGEWAFTGPHGLCSMAVEPLGPTQAELRIVQHGVVVQVLPRPGWPPNLRMVAVADGLPTDLTGFALRETPETRTLLEACEAAVQKHLDREQVALKVLRIAEVEAKRRVDRLERLRERPFIWMTVGAVAICLAALIVHEALPDGLSAGVAFPLFTIPFGLSLLVHFLNTRLRIRPLARGLLPPGTAVREHALTYISHLETSDQVRKALGL